MDQLQGDVAELLAAYKPIVSWINLGEVFYVVRSRRGEADAWLAVRDIQDVTTAELPTTGQVCVSRLFADTRSPRSGLPHPALLAASWTGAR